MTITPAYNPMRRTPRDRISYTYRQWRGTADVER